jgi:hypothetical protein
MWDANGVARRVYVARVDVCYALSQVKLAEVMKLVLAK